LLSGCVGTAGITPRTTPAAVEHWVGDAAIAQAQVAAHWPREQWWRGYGDRQLDQWVERAVRDSPSLATAAARIRQAEALAGSAEASEALQVQGRARLERHDWPADQFYGPGELAGARTWDNQAGLGFSYALDLWGRERASTARALSLAQRSVAQARQAQLELTHNVVRAYVQLSLHFAQREVAEAHLAQQAQLLELARHRLQGGLGTQLEVSQAQTALPDLHRQLDALDERIALDRNQLAALAGQGPAAGATLQRPHLRPGPALALPGRLPAQLLGQRPDVVAARWNVAAQARGLEAAQAAFYPNVDLLGSLGYMATGGGLLTFLAGKKLAYDVGPAVSLPLFDGGRLRGQLGVAAADYDLAVAAYDDTLIQALNSISNQLIRRESLARQTQLAGQGLASAQRTCDLAEQAYRRGLADYSSVLQAQTQLFAQQRIAQNLQAAELLAYAGLATALGGGLGAGDEVPGRAELAAPPLPASLAVFGR